jgi:hypothetical protein
MRLIHFNYLNTERLRRVVNDFCSKIPPPNSASVAFSHPHPASSPVPSMMFLPNPREVAQHEPLWFLPQSPSRGRISIEFGASFERFMRASQWTEDEVKTSLASDGSYMIALTRSLNRKMKNPPNKAIVVVLMSDASTIQQTKAYFHALLLKRRLGEMFPSGAGGAALDWSDWDRLRALEIGVQREVDDTATWKLFCRECQRSGWDLKKSELKSLGYEVTVQYRKT